ncbi:MAG: NAD(P)/FAD-dependent oxidoreductase [Pontiellaceae bacterium]
MKLNNTIAPQSIAVIGSGAAGLTATHLLQQKHQVTLFEASDRIGGHTNTITLQKGADAGLKIDTGFIVMNHRNYPLLTKLFESLNVPLQDSDMSFGYYDLPSGLQYCGSGLSGLFAQRKNLIRPRFYRLIKEVFRFFSTASVDASKGLHPEETLGDYLKRNHFSQDFIDHHLIPMGSAIWSTPCEDMMAFPAQSFMNFFKNHGLLGIKDRPQWRTVQGGSCTYIELMQQKWKNVTIIKNAQIEHIRRIKDGIEIQRIGNIEFFDQVVIATHADQALRMLADPDQLEQNTLGAWRYARSKTYLHTDASVMPPLRQVWSSWNFQRINGNRTTLTYHMNRLQNLPTQNDYFVSLELPHVPNQVHYEIDYEHPMFTQATILKRPQLQAANGQRRTWFAGAYLGNGFHEDAVRSGIEVAEKLGVSL